MFLCYLLGSIPFGYIIPKIKGVDVTKIGSRATSATNVSRAIGWRWGVVVIAADVAKGFAAGLLAVRFIPDPWLLNAALVMPVLGHNFPVWLGFKGGRGATAAYGVLLAFLGLKVAFIFIPWLMVLLATRVMSFTNLAFTVALPLIFVAINPSPAYFFGGFILSLVMLWAFRDNLSRIKAGTEPKVKFRW